MHRSVLLACVYILSSVALFSQEARQPGQLDRRYREGEQLTCYMKGVDDGLHHEVRAVGVVKRNSQGKYFEEYAWSNLTQTGRRSL